MSLVRGDESKMKEKNDKLINNLLRSKFSWWDWSWGQFIKIVKVKSKDSSYQKYLDSIRKDIIKKNSEDSKEDTAYQIYLDIVRNYLKFNKKRLLTKQEEEIVIDHLYMTTLTFCSKHNNKRNDAAHKGLSITQVLSMETAKKVCEIHPDILILTQEQVDQGAEGVLVIQNFLYDEIQTREKREERNEV